ncbi:hypothetical protein MKX54_11045 [Alkalihalobacillus sp. FSL R5-0424]
MRDVQETAKQNVRDLLNVYDVDYIGFNVRDNEISIALKEKPDHKEK